MLLLLRFKEMIRDAKFGIQIGLDWPQMGQICDFLRSLVKPKCTETDLKKSQICPILCQSDPIWMPNLASLASTEWLCSFYLWSRLNVKICLS